MQKKKPTVKTVHSKYSTPKILKPSLSSLGRKNDLALKEKELSQSPYSKSRPQTPISPLKKKNSNNNVKKSSSTEENKIFFPSLPSLLSASEDSIDDLFSKKVKLCFRQCDFTKESSEIFIATKETILKELSTAISDPTIKISDSKANYDLIFSLIALHIFRSPKPIPKEWYSVIDDLFLIDEYHPKNFRHIELIYDIAINFFRRPNLNIEILIELSGDLFKLCVFLCRTIDDREQLKLSELITEIYSKIKPLRHFFLQVIKTAIIRIIYDNEPFTALKPLLISLASIVAGFTKDSIKIKKKGKKKDIKSTSKKIKFSIFFDCLLPIHHLSFLSYYSNELLMVLAQYFEKDGSLVLPLFKEITSHWPISNTNKQLIFIDEISWFASYVENSFITDIIHTIVPLLMNELKSCNSIVTVKILAMWEINDFVWLTVVKPDISYPLLIPSLYEVASSYWKVECRMFAAAVLNVLSINNKTVFLAVGSNLKKIQNLFILKNLDTGNKWINLIQNYESSKNLKKIKMEIVSSIFIGCDAIRGKQKE